MPTLVVQMGHAGRTTGATGAPGEQAYAQAVGASCARLLDGRGGWRVRLIVADPGLDSYRGDAFVAVHADGSNNPDVRGASVGYQTPQGAALAHDWHDAYVRLGFSGPWHRDNYTDNLHYYYGVTNAVKVGNIRACIIEAGTITNAADRALMDPDRVALAIGWAVGITSRTEDTDMQPTDRVEIPYPYRDTGDSFEIRQALGFPLYISADMAKNDKGQFGPEVTNVNGSNRLSIPALRDDVDALLAKVDELTDLVRRALGAQG